MKYSIQYRRGDNDGIPDGDEDRNYNGMVDPGETDPINPDTDGDGIKDGYTDTGADGDFSCDESGFHFDKNPDPSKDDYHPILASSVEIISITWYNANDTILIDYCMSPYAWWVDDYYNGSNITTYVGGTPHVLVINDTCIEEGNERYKIVCEPDNYAATTLTKVVINSDGKENDGNWDSGESKGEDQNNGGSITGDTDQDRVWDSGETWTETNPLDIDTDDDGLPDGKIGDFGEDLDCDGIRDSSETDPLDWDSDDDALPDGLEKGMTESHITGDTDISKNHFWPDVDAGATTTDPIDSDTDDDGIPDGWIDWNNDDRATMLEGEDINLDGAIGGDVNLDGIWNDEEEWNETSPISLDFDEDGVADGIDTDKDGLPDGLELGLTTTQSQSGDTGSLPGKYLYQWDADKGVTTTDPLSLDTDGDGLPDGWIDGWGYDSETNEWGLYNDPNQIKNLCEGEDFDRDGQYDIQPTLTNEQGAIIGETIPDRITDLNGDKVPDGPDTDGDGLQDGLEEAGWQVEVYYERNPKIRFTSYDVWSDPLVKDTDDDGLDDLNESTFGGDPRISDTDNDRIGDADEIESGSSVDGIEAYAPMLEGNLSLDKSYDYYSKWKYGVWLGYRVKVVVKVAGVVTDNVGVLHVYIKVSGSGVKKSNYLYPETDEEAKRFEFKDEFNFGLSLSSLWNDFWAGWDIYVNISDVNKNTAEREDHINSVIEALVDVLLKAIAILIDLILEWLKDKVKSIFKRALSPVKAGVEFVVGGFVDTIQEVKNGETEFWEGVEEVYYNLFFPLWITMLIISLVLEAIVLILGFLLSVGVIIEILLTLLMPVLFRVLSASGDEKGNNPGDGIFNKLLETLGVSSNDIDDFFDSVSTKRSNEYSREQEDNTRGAGHALLSGVVLTLCFVIGIFELGRVLLTPLIKNNPLHDTFGFVAAAIGLCLAFLSITESSDKGKSMDYAFYSFVLCTIGMYITIFNLRSSKPVDVFTLIWGGACYAISLSSVLLAYTMD